MEFNALETKSIAVGYALQHFGANVKQGVSHPKFHESIHQHTSNSSVKACPNFKNQLKNATQESEQCFHLHYDPEHHNFCNFISKEFKKCAKPITSLLKSCLPKHSKDTPEFLVDSVVDLFKFVCTTKGSTLLELTQPCITHSLSEDPNMCSHKFESKLMEFRKKFPNKAEVCEFETSFRGCLHSQLEQNCTSYVTIDNFFKFYDALGEPCNKLK